MYAPQLASKGALAAGGRVTAMWCGQFKVASRGGLWHAAIGSRLLDRDPLMNILWWNGPNTNTPKPDLHMAPGPLHPAAGRLVSDQQACGCVEGCLQGPASTPSSLPPQHCRYNFRHLQAPPALLGNPVSLAHISAILPALLLTHTSTDGPSPAGRRGLAAGAPPSTSAPVLVLLAGPNDTPAAAPATGDAPLPIRDAVGKRHCEHAALRGADEPFSLLWRRAGGDSQVAGGVSVCRWPPSSAYRWPKGRARLLL